MTYVETIPRTTHIKTSKAVRKTRNRRQHFYARSMLFYAISIPFLSRSMPFLRVPIPLLSLGYVVFRARRVRRASIFRDVSSIKERFDRLRQHR
jgi:hypothetical protein